MSEKITRRSHEEFVNSLRILQPSKKAICEEGDDNVKQRTDSHNSLTIDGFDLEAELIKAFDRIFSLDEPSGE